MKTLNIFYEEPDPDRWLPFDRYPRKLVRRIIRGNNRPGGQAMVAINLIEGLKKINYPFRFNDYRYVRKHPEELACVIGKSHIIFEKKILVNPILFGASVFSHPIDCPDLFKKYANVRAMLVPGAWMEEMCRPYYGNKVITWPVGIDTETWACKKDKKNTDFLIYDKIRWEHADFQAALIDPILETLKSKGLRFELIRYGEYNPEEYQAKLNRCKAMIFLCEHETQGLANLQALSCNVPVMAWDRGGYWQDPAYYPEKVTFQPVTSVPYWDERCGMKFKDLSEFNMIIDDFLRGLLDRKFEPRSYILEHLTLEKCAQKYLDIVNSIQPLR